MKRTFTLITIGFQDSERRLLKSICALSRGRPCSYALLDKSDPQAPNIAMVNGDEPNAVSEWRSWHASHPKVPIVVVANAQWSQADVYCVKRPFTGTRVLRILDEVAINTHKYAPDIAIGGEDGCLDDMLIRTLTPKSSGHRHRALVVDDSAPVRKMMELALRIAGIHGDFAASAAEASAHLRDTAYDIVFLDVVLPDVDGYQICRKIKADKGTKRTPVVMLTSKTSPFDRVKGKLAGCDSYLSKPVENEQLQRTIAKYLSVGFVPTSEEVPVSAS